MTWVTARSVSRTELLWVSVFDVKEKGESYEDMHAFSICDVQ